MLYSNDLHYFILILIKIFTHFYIHNDMCRAYKNAPSLSKIKAFHSTKAILYTYIGNYLSCSNWILESMRVYLEYCKQLLPGRIGLPQALFNPMEYTINEREYRSHAWVVLPKDGTMF